jgi:hypothetical protein
MDKPKFLNDLETKRQKDENILIENFPAHVTDMRSYLQLEAGAQELHPNVTHTHTGPLN